MRPPVSSQVAVAVAAALYGTHSGAQTAVSQDSGLEEIVVTATRRAQSVLDVPYNITAVSADSLAKLGVTDTSALVRIIPGLNDADAGTRGSGLRSNYTLRGLNADAASPGDDNPRLNQPTVSTYLGDTPITYPSLKLVDLERVEVLRGPQGTLYGSGSIGGTIRFIPKKAELNKTTVEVSQEGSSTEHAGDLGYDGRVTVNIPAGDNAAFRATVDYQRVAGFIDAVGLVQQTGTPLHPGDVVLADPAHPLTSPAAAAAARLDNNDAAIMYSQAQLRLVPSSNLEVTFDYRHQQTHANDRSADNRNYGTGQQYVNYTEFASPEESRIDLFSADVAVDFGFARLSSNSAYARTFAHSVSGDGSGFLGQNLAQYYFGYPRLIAPEIRDELHRTTTQEFRLVSRGGQKLDWVVGAFYSRDKLDFSLFQPMSGINDYTNAVLGITPALNFTDILATGGTNQTFTDLAFFGESTLNVTNRWQVTGGVRVFHQTLDGTSGIALPFASRTLQYFISGQATNDFLLGKSRPIANVTNDQVFKLNTSYKLNEGALVFATWSQGFRAGGANALSETNPNGSSNAALLHFKPDDAVNYEIGVKGELGHRFQYSVTAFAVDWKDFQTTLVSPQGVFFTGNVPRAKSRGIELTAGGYLTSTIAANIGYAYTKATVAQAFDLRLNDPSTTIESGTTLPNAPRQSLFANISYEQNVGASAITYQVDASHRGSATSYFRPIPSLPTSNFALLDPYTVWNASITWHRNPYSVTLFGKNLASTRGTTSVTTEGLVGLRDQGEGVLTPRTIGLRFQWSLK